MTEYNKIKTVSDLLKVLNDLVAVNPDILNAVTVAGDSGFNFSIQGYKKLCNTSGTFDKGAKAVSPHEINTLIFTKIENKNAFDIIRKKNDIVRYTDNTNKFKTREELCKELSYLDYDKAVMKISKQIFNYGDFCHVPGKGWMMLMELEDNFKKCRPGNSKCETEFKTFLTQDKRCHNVYRCFVQYTVLTSTVLRDFGKEFDQLAENLKSYNENGKKSAEKAEQELREKAEQELREKAEQELREREKTEQELREKAEQELREKAEQELVKKAEQELREKTERECLLKVNEEQERLLKLKEEKEKESFIHTDIYKGLDKIIESHHILGNVCFFDISTGTILHTIHR